MNLLKTKTGRLAAFSGLYLSEGLPGGFLMMAIATELQRRGMGTAAYGTFVSVLALPWIWKFLMGPFVDNLRIKRFGARKQWIVGAQSGMLLALCAAMYFMPEKVVIEDTDGSDTVQRHYVWGNYIDELLLMRTQKRGRESYLTLGVGWIMFHGYAATSSTSCGRIGLPCHQPWWARIRCRARIRCQEPDS